MRYVALLRGINVGGRHLIPMVDLRAAVAALGAADVTTYIQGGNVLFDAGDDDPATWTERLEAALSARFDYAASVVLRSHDELRAVVAGAPPDFGREPDRFREDVLFLKAPLDAASAIAQVPTRAGVDRVVAGDGVLYASRLAERASQSRLPRIVGLPIYQHMTIRNWRTTTTLLRLLDERT